MIKVLHVYKDSLPHSTGGVETFLDTLCQHTAKLGVENTILTFTKNPATNPIYLNNYCVYQAKRNCTVAATALSIQAFKLLKKLAQEADIIHYHFPHPFTDLLHFTCRINKPTLVTYHSDIIKQKYLLKLYQPLMNKFLRSVDHIVATSPKYLNSSPTLQRFKAKTTVIPIGIDLPNLLQPDPDRVRYWKELFPQPFFLFIGVLRYYKGLHVALEAIRGTDIQLVIGGKGHDEASLKEQACDIPNAHFLGFLADEDKAALLHLCYGFVFPSHLRSEAFGIALLEAAAYEKPLISCEIGTGTSYINQHQVTGLVVRPNSPDELRQAMQYLLLNPAEASLYGKQAKSRAQVIFTAENQAISYQKIYNSSLENMAGAIDKQKESRQIRE
jgi:rhamnosyl/mannosyltransferase